MFVAARAAGRAYRSAASPTRLLTAVGVAVRFRANVVAARGARVARLFAHAAGAQPAISAARCRDRHARRDVATRRRNRAAAALP